MVRSLAHRTFTPREILVMELEAQVLRGADREVHLGVRRGTRVLRENSENSEERMEALVVLIGENLSCDDFYSSPGLPFFITKL